MRRLLRVRRGLPKVCFFFFTFLFPLLWILVLRVIRAGMYANGLLDAQFAAVIGGGLAVAAGWFV